MRGGGGSTNASRTPATDFVQDYAAKRQAQMLRARQLREERLQNQPPPPHGLSSGAVSTAAGISPSGGGPLVAPRPRNSVGSPLSPGTTGPDGGAGHGLFASGRSNGSTEAVLYVKEDDFKKATQAGIITPDQARQLWAMLSNQIIRVPPSSPVNAVSVNSLMALSHGSPTASASPSSFGGSISMESLRRSIVMFKQEQERLLSGGGSGVATGGGGAAGGGHRPPHKTTVHTSASHFHRSPDGSGIYDARGSDAAPENEEDNESHDGVGVRARGIPPVAVPGAPRRTAGGGGNASNSRPGWNFDTAVSHGGEDSDGNEQVYKAREPSQDAVPARRPAPRGVKTKALRPGVSKPSTTAGGGLQQQQPPPPPGTPPSSSAVSSSAAAPAVPRQRHTPAANNNYSNRGSGAILNFDDMPVGSGGGGAMNDWANAYAPGMGPPPMGGPAPSSLPPGKRGAMPTAMPASSGGGTEPNDIIAAAAAAAANEPVSSCSCCGRSFRASVLSRHEALCRKQSKKPRKIFDMQGQRLEGVEGIQEVMHGGSKANANIGHGGNNNNNGQRRAGARGDDAAGGAAKGKLPKWKVQHEQFQAAMRAVRQQAAGGAGGGGGGFGTGKLPPPPAPVPEEYDDRVPCPHCGRKFAEEVAARHIPKCSTTIAKPKGIRPIRR